MYCIFGICAFLIYILYLVSDPLECKYCWDPPTQTLGDHLMPPFEMKTMTTSNFIYWEQSSASEYRPNIEHKFLSWCVVITSIVMHCRYISVWFGRGPLISYPFILCY
jgi:hypothetical protein